MRHECALDCVQQHGEHVGVTKKSNSVKAVMDDAQLHSLDRRRKVQCSAMMPLSLSLPLWKVHFAFFLHDPMHAPFLAVSNAEIASRKSCF